MKEILERLHALAEPEYAAFQARLVPGIPAGSVLGVRVPALRALAGEITKAGLRDAFLAELPHGTYDENLLHAILLAEGRDYAATLRDVEAFLPYVDNWAVCDTLRPKVFRQHTAELRPAAEGWVRSSAVYTCRFGMDMLMTYYLGEGFSPADPELIASVTLEDYYVRTMAAWYFATALAERWDEILPFIEQRRLPEWTRRKAIQKALESYRITPEEKDCLRHLR